MQRRRARVLAFQTLFELESRERSPEDVLEDRIRDFVEDGLDVDEETRAWALALVQGTEQQREVVDDLIRPAAPAFPLDQLAATDRIDMELAVYQMTFESSVPVRVAINEAVDLAKRYGGESSGRFVNGVLGTIAKGLGAQRQ